MADRESRAVDGDKMSALDDLITQARDTGGESLSIDAAAELAELKKKVQQADWFRSTLDIAVTSPEKDTPFKKLEVENAQLRLENDQQHELAMAVMQLQSANERLAVALAQAQEAVVQGKKHVKNLLKLVKTQSRGFTEEASHWDWCDAAAWLSAHEVKK